MIELLYRRILKKLKLNNFERNQLKEKLTTSNICKGPFLKNGKMCPNTTALAIKERVNAFQSTDQVKAVFKHYGISKFDLWLFYALYDVPALMSERLFDRLLQKLRNTV